MFEASKAQRRRVVRQLWKKEPIAAEDRSVAREIARTGGTRTPARRVTLLLSMLFFVLILAGAIFGHYDPARRWVAGVGSGLFVVLGIAAELVRLRWRSHLKRQP